MPMSGITAGIAGGLKSSLLRWRGWCRRDA
nr:MAG TPA: hypothetical protein [Caudoviricetes sp.]DAQ08858.1 MAG TPA: hypothetical protein [Caudoviricetes sp.]